MTLLPPQPVGVPPGHGFWNDWNEKMRFLLNSTAGVSLTATEKTDLTDGGATTLHTHAHNNLQSIQGGAAADYFHFTGTEHTDLTDGGSSTLHFHASDRDSANFTGTSWTDLTDAGDSALHFHSSDRNSANFTGTNWVDLTDAGDSALHFHSSDRARANHTGTQTMSTISDLPVLASGTYTPTFTSVANVTATTGYVAQYLRVGAVVTVSGKVDIDPNLAATITQVGISLPIASALTAAEQVAGTAVANSTTTDGLSGSIAGDATNDRAELLFVPTSVANTGWFFTFTYRII